MLARTSHNIRSRPKAETSLFVSHHVSTHKIAAERIKQVLESRSPRLEVETCESMFAGQHIRHWIKTNLCKSKLLIVLLPEHENELQWIKREVNFFRKVCEEGYVVVLKQQAQPRPRFADEILVVETSQEELRTRFLEPLFHRTTYTGLPKPLNSTISLEDLDNDANEIRLVLSKTLVQDYGNRVTVDMTSAFNVSSKFDLRNAWVTASLAFGKLLNWDKETFRWHELRARAKKDPGKGTFWVDEMKSVMQDVANNSQPRVMSSTFRSLGESRGRIFQPQLTEVQKVAGRPIRFEFAFYQVLSPELVRGPEDLGAIYSLLYLANRIRWEVLNPFLVNRYIRQGQYRSDHSLTSKKKYETIQQIRHSFECIEAEEVRHEIVDKGVKAFDHEERSKIQPLINERELIRSEIAAAIEDLDFERLMKWLARSLDLNSRIMQVLADKFRELTNNDRAKVEAILHATHTKAIAAHLSCG